LAVSPYQPPFAQCNQYLVLQDELLRVALSTSENEFTTCETAILQCVRPLIFAADAMHWGTKETSLQDLKIVSTSLEVLMGHAKWLEHTAFNVAMDHPFPWEYHYEQFFLGLELDKVLQKFGERILLYLKTEHNKSSVPEISMCKVLVQRIQSLASNHVTRNRAAALHWRREVLDWYEQYDDTVEEIFEPGDKIGTAIMDIVGEQRIKRSLETYLDSCLDGLDGVVALAKLT